MGPPRATVGESIPVAGNPDAIAVVGDVVWVAGDRLQGFDIVSGVILTEVDLIGPSTLLSDDGDLLAVSRGYDRSAPDDASGEPSGLWLHRIESESGRISAAVPLGGGGDVHLAIGGGAIWVAVENAERIFRLDSEEAVVIGLENAGTAGPLAFAGQALWSLRATEGGRELSFFRLEITTGETANSIDVTVPSGEGRWWFQVVDLIAYEGDLWASVSAFPGAEQGEGEAAGLVIHADADVGEVIDVIPTGRRGGRLAAGNGIVFATDCPGGTLTMIDSATGEISGQPLVLGAAAPDGFGSRWYLTDYACPWAVAYDEGMLWVGLWIERALVPVAVDR